MTRFKGEFELKVMVNQMNLVCCKCHHIRENEPYVRETYWPTIAEARTKYTCWRCCRDAESTLFIFRKWPLAFNRRVVGPYYHLEWAPGVKELVVEHGEV